MYKSNILRLFSNRIFLYVLSFIFPVVLILFACMFAHIFPFGDKTYILWDSDLQFVPFLGYFKSIFTSNTDFVYSLSKAGGSGMFEFNTCYLNNPLNFISFLFPDNRLDVAFEVITLFKIAMSGLAFSFFLNFNKPFDKYSLLFSTAYALATCSLYYSQSIMGYEGMYLLPVALVGIEKIIKEQKAVLFVLITTFGFLLEPYAGFVILLFSFFYFLYFYFLNTPENKKRVFGLYFISVFFIITMSLITTLPSWFALQGTKYHIKFIPELFFFRLSEVFPFLYTGTVYNSLFYGSSYPYIYSGILPLILFIGYFVNKEISRKEKLLSGLFVCFILFAFCWHVLFTVFNGGNPLPLGCIFRFVYVFVFLFLLLAYKSFNKYEFQSSKSITLIAVIFVLVTISVLCESAEYVLNKAIVTADLLLGFIFIFLLAIKNKTNQKKMVVISALLLFILSFGELITNTFICFSSQEECRLSSPKEFSSYYKNISGVIKNIQERDKGFYRIDTEETLTKGKSWFKGHYNNNALMFNYNAISHYSSLGKISLRNFYAKLGFDIYPANHIIGYSDNMPLFAPSFLGIKYIISDKENHINPYIKADTVLTEKPLFVYQNPYALPIGFLSESNILSLQIKDKNVFEIYNIIPKTILGQDFGDIYTVNPIEYTEFSEANKIAKARFINKETEPLWLTQTGIGFDGFQQFTANNKLLREPFENIAYTVEYLGSFDRGEEVIINAYRNYIIAQKQRPDFLYASQNADKLAEYFDLIKQKACDLKVITSSHLKGSFTAVKDNQVLVLTIPYDENWEIKIDGKKVEQLRVLEELTGVLIKKQGRHSIEMKYKTKGLLPSALLSLFSLFLFMFLIRKKYL